MSIHLWHWPLSQSSLYDVSSLLATLSQEEKNRAARFVSEADRTRFIISHGIARQLLANALATTPADLHFSYNEYGKPFLSPPHNLQFNLSHTTTLAVLGIAENTPIGVDVEDRRDNIDIHGIAKRFFTPLEVEELLSLPKDLHLNAFFHLWACKEAVLKALGKGFALPVREVEVSVDPRAPAKLISLSGDAVAAAEWALMSVDLGAPYACAIAVRNTPQIALSVNCWRSSPART